MLSSIASFLPSALHLNNNTTQEYVQVGPTITPDTDDEEELGDNDVQPNGNASQSGVQGQQPQGEESTELNGQPQGAKGAAKSAVEVGIFLVFWFWFVLRWIGLVGRWVSMLYGGVRTTSRRGDATTTDTRFVRRFSLSLVFYRTPFSIFGGYRVLPRLPALEPEH